MWMGVHGRMQAQLSALQPQPQACCLQPCPPAFCPLHSVPFPPCSAGILLMQMAVPQLRSSANIRAFNAQLQNFDFDLERWRQYNSSKFDFSTLDRWGSGLTAGWLGPLC